MRVNKQYYKDFAQTMVPFCIDDCDWICGKINDDEVILHIYVSTKRENEQTYMFKFRKNFCELNIEGDRWDLDKYWNEYNEMHLNELQK